jgi:AMP deaminase
LPDADPATFDQLPTQSEFAPWKLYPRPPEPHWHQHESGDKVLKPARAIPERETFNFKACEIPGKHEWAFKIDERGVYQIYADEKGMMIQADTSDANARLYQRHQTRSLARSSTSLR